MFKSNNCCKNGINNHSNIFKLILIPFSSNKKFSKLNKSFEDTSSSTNKINLSEKTQSKKSKFNDHYPVMYKNIIELIKNKYDVRKYNSKHPMIIGDLTLGCGNHTETILETFPNTKVIGVDLDESMAKYSNRKLKEYVDNNRLSIITANYDSIREIFIDEHFTSESENRKFDFILVDLGFNSKQLEDHIGISYQFPDDDLDMRYCKIDDQFPKASEVLNNSTELELLEIIHKYGEEKYTETLVKNILKFRESKKFIKVKDLISIIDYTFQDKNINKFNTYARIFQALRITVNNEFINLQSFLGGVSGNMEDEGLLSVISFHSLEDKIVKYFFQQFEKNKLGTQVNRHALKADTDEINENSRSKSALLRSFKFKVVE